MDKRLFLLGLGAFCVSTVAFVFAGVLPLISQSTGIPIANVGALVAVYSLSYAIGTPILSAMAGTYNRRSVLLIGMAAFVLGNLMIAASATVPLLFLAQMGTGMAAGLFAATAQAIAVQLAGPEHRAKAISVVVGGTTFAVALGAPLGTFFAHMLGWRETFVGIGLVGLLCVAALRLWLPDNLAGSRLSLGSRLGVIRRPGVLRAISVTFLYLAGGFSLISYLGPLAIEGVGLPQDILPVVMLAYGVGAIAGNYTSGRLADDLGARRVVVTAIMSSILLAVVMSCVARFVPDAIAGPLLIALMLIWGFVGWIFPPAQTSRLVALAPDVAHLTLALNGSAIYLGIATGTFVGGRVLALASVNELGLVGAGFALLALGLVVTDRAGARRLAGQQA
ncbi:putative MFS family arabinose efflux permease [Hoeflea marina]|uniref:Putative MFS family arabinose efflux permease n=1 Tax=Hoeflea marina TaxID=274592 RepID=A0A317PG73_9HYPH|nr:MFS transporter [Hoeflea marina]PWV97661.1 putative MFS family arabinose efflux permease [Hoeflea marina]